MPGGGQITQDHVTQRIGMLQMHGCHIDLRAYEELPEEGLTLQRLPADQAMWIQPRDLLLADCKRLLPKISPTNHALPSLGISTRGRRRHLLSARMTQPWLTHLRTPSRRSGPDHLHRS